ncbi:MAG TPA: endoribonuclease MazF [bacterium]|nr:endoribonuclease MazF [bacterium]
MEYIPDRGDVIWLNFTPQAGREQAGHRPALVISPKEYNRKTGLAVMCPMTTHVKGYPFEVVVSSGPEPSVVLSDHLKNLDWRERKATYKGKISQAALKEVMNKISALLMIE